MCTYKQHDGHEITSITERCEHTAFFMHDAHHDDDDRKGDRSQRKAGGAKRQVIDRPDWLEARHTHTQAGYHHDDRHPAEDDVRQLQNNNQACTCNIYRMIYQSIYVSGAD